MQAVISGQLGLALFKDNHQTYLVNVDEPESSCAVNDRDASLAFRDARDSVHLSNTTRERVIHALNLAWSKDRSLQLTLIFIDHAEDADLRQEAMAFVDEQFGQPEVIDFVAARLWSAPLPTSADLLGAIRLSAGFSRVHHFLTELQSDQLPIDRVRQAWDAVADTRLEDPSIQGRLEDRLIALGIFRSLAVAVRTHQVGSAIVECLGHPVLRKISGNREWIGQWTKPLKDSSSTFTASITTLGDPIEDYEDGPITENPDQLKGRLSRKDLRSSMRAKQPTRHEQRLRAEKELESIFSLLRQGQAARAEEWVFVLAERQASDGEAPLAAKSLSNIAQECKRLKHFPVQLRLMERAVQLSPNDPQSHCQFAEALRSNRRPDEALARYEQSVRQFPQDEVAANGLAETLRELGRPDEALARYEQSVRQFPRSCYAIGGKASTLIDLKRFDEAGAVIRAATQTTGNPNWVLLHMEGMYLLRVRDFGQAISIFERGVRENPSRRDRQYFASALATAQIHAQRLADAEASLAIMSGETATLLRCHVAYEQGQLELASDRMNQLSTPKTRIGKKLAGLFQIAIQSQMSGNELERWRSDVFSLECELVRIPQKALTF